MKKIIYFSLISLLLSCGGGGSEDITPEEPDNTAPSAPVLKTPTDNTLCINNTVDFEWNKATDADGDAINYQLQIATDNQFSNIIKTESTSSLEEAVTLSKGVAYYWRVKAIDNKSASGEYSSVFSFYTEAVTISNHLPFLPQLVQPSSASPIDGSEFVRLRWSAKDVDTQDTLIFDVYFGTDSATMTKVGDNIATPTLDVESLLGETTYYWKVVVKDNKGGETNGSVWSFTTN